MSERIISVVVPVRNEADSIESAVESILRQAVPGSLQVIVADGMSTDGTRHTLDRLSRQHPELTVVDNAAGTTPAGLNAAIAVARGDVIVRCDAHAELPAGYIARAVETLDATGAGNVGGVQRAVGITPIQRAIAVGMTTPLGVGDARFHRGGAAGPVDTVYLGVFRRSVLAEVGTYDESLIRNQDYELNARIRAAGHAVHFDPALEVTYRPRRTLAALASQYFQYGRWKRLVVTRRSASLLWRQAVPPLFVLALAASLLLLGFGSSLGAVVPAVYGAAVVGVALVETVRRRDGAVLALVIVLPVMHLSWGVGFLVGRSDPPPPQVGSVG